MSDRRHHIAVTAIGPDRPGIVAAVTQVLFDLGCNLEDATSTILRGHFSIVLVVNVPPEIGFDDVQNALEPAGRDLGLVVSARPVGDAAPAQGRATHMVSVYGADRPGIVFKVTAALAERSVNILDLNSRMLGDDDAIYALMLEVAAPKDMDLAAELDALRTDLGVELTVSALDPDLF
ncbi:MAG TPA: ACT domain-containing protein [Actinomycetota bacterium]|nr:ACT domain-containing protein [Actinomycetota bacterium]